MKRSPLQRDLREYECLKIGRTYIFCFFVTDIGMRFLLCRPHEKSLFAAKYQEDGKWYRGQTHQYNTEGVVVLFVDYGNYAVLPLTHLHTLESPYCSLPLQAVPCGISGFNPARAWSDTECSQFKQFLMEIGGPTQPLKAKIISKTPEGYVTLEILHPRKNKPIFDDFLEVQENNSEDFTVHHQQVASQPSPVISQAKSASVIESLNTEETTKSPTEIFMVSDLPKPTEVARNTSVPVTISCIENLNLFTVELLGNPEFSELKRILESFSMSAEHPSSPPINGQLVCVQEGEIWYRAEVLAHKNQTVKVSLIDYGQIINYELDEIAAPDERMIQYPIQCIKCMFADIIPTEQTWDPERLTKDNYFIKVVGKQGMDYIFIIVLRPKYQFLCSQLHPCYI